MVAFLQRFAFCGCLVFAYQDFKKSTHLVFILSQHLLVPLLAPFEMISCGILAQILGRTPRKLLLYTSSDLARTVGRILVPSKLCLVRFLQRRSGSVTIGMKFFSSPRAFPSSNLSSRANDMAAASLQACKGSTMNLLIFFF